MSVPTTTAATTITTPPQALFPRPSSPIKPELKPNPHPYAIKTTSTGALSRSNSSPHNPEAARSLYIPAASPGSPKRPSQKGHHRYSKSWNSETPLPLPVPPSFLQTADGNEEDETPRRLKKRADTLPGGALAMPVMTQAEDLSLNPKEWTPGQVATYLSTALRVKSGETLALPLPVARDIAKFVRASGITGKTFLRLGISDLERMGVNSLWSTALLTASRNLRQNVLRGRIWETGHVSDDDAERDGVRSAPVLTEGQRRQIFRQKDHAANVTGGGNRHGRVKGMVESLERCGSMSEGSTGGGARRRSGSVSSQGSAWSADEIESPVRGDEALEKSEEAEPTVEAFLRAGPVSGQEAWGARAWEEDVGTWETVKRVEGDRGQDVPVHDRPEDEGDGDPEPDSDADFAAGLAGSTTKKAEAGQAEGRSRSKKERRVVTAIFAGNPSDQANSAPRVSGETTQEDSQGEVVRLRSQVDDTWTLLQAFKRRLEEVESKIGHMEERAHLQARENEETAARREEEDRYDNERRMAQERELLRAREAEEAERLRMEDNRLSLSLLLQPRTLFSRLLRLISPSMPHAPSLPTRARDSSKLERILNPTTISALPPYFLLVSLGICAVVLRVVIRRIMGRRRAWDL